ncbi:hypothetical protein ASD02_27905 [Ensifer sp. Root1252]|nr:hypothetical protein ASD02_27905 [Ensifer sp. Root1252]KQW78651.1 hypothetical protein ASD03_26640 [Ensifer sp. Root127]KRC74070.1 hypothetical protein ASE32_32610 [Ensifer sp. Root231]KRC96942.1 hypothetical protein ASE47_30590 [Ensifer sp. Root258]
MAAIFSEDFDKKIGSAINYGGMSLEVRRRVHETAKLHARNYSVEVPVEGGTYPGHKVQSAKTSGLIAVFRRDVLPHHADEMLDTVDTRDLS